MPAQYKYKTYAEETTLFSILLKWLSTRKQTPKLIIENKIFKKCKKNKKNKNKDQFIEN